ncbi:MAG: DUF2207 domain-containing protein [Pseudodonghicola sp.]|nr:DUF2207 domain-containing protein [Pseudodonghicola sp.]
MLRCVFRLAFVLLLGFAPAAQAAEVIRFFESDVQIREDGTLEVSETITVTAEGDAVVHGIYRDFPRDFIDSDGGRGRVSFEVLSVERDGIPEVWSVETITGGSRVRIGDSDTEVSPGVHVYRIAYLTDRQIRFREGYDLLVWNVTGDGWMFPIEAASASVSLPGRAAPLDVAAHTGARGQTGRDAMARISGDKAVFRTTRALDAFEGITVEVQLPKGVVAEPTAAQRTVWWWRDNLAAMIGLGGLIAVFAYFLAIWSVIGRDPKPGVIVPRWDLPKGISPALAAYIDNSGLSGGGWTALAASVIDLAVKGYVSLEDLNKTVTLRRTDQLPADALPAGQAVLMNAFGTPGETLTLDRAHGDEIETLNTDFRAAIEAENAGRFFTPNRGPFLVGLLASLGVAVAWFLASDVATEDAGMLAFSCCVPLLLDLGVWKMLKAWRRGSAGRRLLLLIGIIGIAVFGLALFGVFWAVFSDMFGPAGAVLVLSMGWGLVLINQVFFVLGGTATAVGREIKDHIAGLRLYLTLAEKDRMNLRDAPRMSPSHFETLLPYAVVLGVERRWSKSFERWLATSTAGAAATYAPIWYAGQRDHIAQDIGTIAASMSSSMAASVPEGSSFGSGASGSGGGGGGGGGW